MLRHLRFLWEVLTFCICRVFSKPFSNSEPPVGIVISQNGGAIFVIAAFLHVWLWFKSGEVTESGYFALFCLTKRTWDWVLALAH